MTQPPKKSELARLLDEARIRQHLSIRATAKLADLPAATVQGWLSGRHLPTPALRPQFERLAAALGVADEVNRLLTRLNPAIATLRRGDPPYLGLRSFTTEDADIFFGRSAEARRIARAVLDLPVGQPLIVLGPSGSGKSSVLAAGLVAAETRSDGLLAGRRGAVVIVEQLRKSLPDADLIVVDQFEDALDAPDRDAVIGQVLTLAAKRSVVLAVRSDAYGALSELPALKPALERPVLLTPLTEAELQQAIMEPAKSRGIEVMPSLVQRLMRDLVPEGPGHPFSLPMLPLLSNALLLTWGIADGGPMTVKDYELTGGLAAAVESLAEGVFRQLPPEQHDAAQRLFLKLVRPAGDKIVSNPEPWDRFGPDTRAVAEAFVDARILTTSRNGVRISHAALLRHWPRLATWIEESRETLVVRDHLQRATQLWLATGRSAEALLPVDRLPLFEAFLEPNKHSLLSPEQHEFLTQSRAHFTSQLDAERATSARLRRSGRTSIAFASVAVALSLVTGAALVNSNLVQRQAQSRQVALQSSSLRNVDRNVQAQLSLVGMGLSETREARSALLDAASDDVPVRWAGAGAGYLAVSPDGAKVARGDAGGVTLWDTETVHADRGNRFEVDPDGRQVFTVAFANTSAGRRLLALGGSAGLAALWDVTDEPTKVADIDVGTFTGFSVAFDETGERLFVGSSDGSNSILDVYSLATPDRPARTASWPLGAKVFTGLFVGDRLYVGGAPGVISVWDLSDPEPAELPALDFGHPTIIAQALAVSPDGGKLVAGLGDRTIVQWDLEAPLATMQETSEGLTNYVNAVAFSPDGEQIIVGDSDQKVHIFDAETLAEERTMPGPSIFIGAGFANGRPIASSVDGTLWVWDRLGHVVKRPGGGIFQLSVGGNVLAGGVPGDRVHLWDTTDHAVPLPPAVPPVGVRITSGTFVAPDGSALYAGAREGTIVRWRLDAAGARDPEVLDVLTEKKSVISLAVDPTGTLLLACAYQGHTSELWRIAPDGALTHLATLPTEMPQVASFSADGKLVQVGVVGGVQVWNVRDPRRPVLASTIDAGGLPSVSAFAPKSPLLAVGSDAGELAVWDVSDPTDPKQTHSYTDARSALYAAAFSADESTLAAGGADELYWGWDLSKPKEPAAFALNGHGGRSNEVRFISSDMLAGANADGSVRVWHINPSDARARLCGHRGVPLTADEWDRHLPGVRPFDPCE